MAKYVIIDPATLTTSCPLSEDEKDGHDLTGMTVVEVDDDFDPRTNVVDFDALTITPSLDKVRQDKKDELANYRDDVVLATVSTSDFTFYTSEKAKLTMAGKLLGVLIAERMSIPAPTTIRFKTANAGWQTFSTDDFCMAALEVLGGIEAVFSDQEELEATIDSLTDPEDIEAVEWA